MHYSTPVTAAGLMEELNSYQGVSLAYDGMSINI
jgi:hypothetical protein